MVVSKQHEQHEQRHRSRSYAKIGLARQGKPCINSETSSIDSFCQQELFRPSAKTQIDTPHFVDFIDFGHHNTCSTHPTYFKIASEPDTNTTRLREVLERVLIIWWLAHSTGDSAFFDFVGICCGQAALGLVHAWRMLGIAHILCLRAMYPRRTNQSTHNY